MTGGTTIDPNFEAEMRAQGLHEKLVEFLLTNCGTLERFSCFAESRSEVVSEILEKVPEVKGDRAQRAALIA